MSHTFNGRPCGKCSGTLRYIANRNCVACAKERSARLREERLKEYEGDTVYESEMQCRTCKGYVRYVTNNTCVKCNLADTRQRYRSRKEEQASET
jgi:hypothetical protein